MKKDAVLCLALVALFGARALPAVAAEPKDLTPAETPGLDSDETEHLILEDIMVSSVRKAPGGAPGAPGTPPHAGGASDPNAPGGTQAGAGNAAAAANAVRTTPNAPKTDQANRPGPARK